MGKPILKAYYRNIFFEFLVHPDKRDAIIILPGFPSSNVMDDIIYFFYEKGFNVFVPRYPGSYQSKGQFLKTNPITDLLKFIDQLKKGKAVSLWDDNEISFEISKIFVFGGSFGGSVALALATGSKGASKVVLISPVWDFKEHNKQHNEQDLDSMTCFVKKAYKNLYRYQFNSLVQTVSRFKEFSPKYYLNKLNTPILVFHDPDDKSVSINHSRDIKKVIKDIQIVESDTGHGLSIKLLNKYFDKIKSFLES